MKKLLLITGLLTNLVFTAYAIHITGGEMYYKVTGQANGEIQYQFTLKLYMRCNSGRTLPNPAIISIFDKGTSARVSDLNVPMSNTETISYNNTNPCISDPPDICFVIGYYSFNVSLPPSSAGYVLASTANFRINSISNLVPGNSRIGALYSAEIPGNASLTGAAINNSAEFIGSDLVLICANNPFSYSFAATDADGDQLRYSFCDAYQSNTDGNNAVPPNPPFSPVPYYYPYFGGGNPLGPNISIDQNTGLITGVAPDEGVYIVTVCVDEIRNGVVIATQRKDVQINSAPCSIASAILQPEYLLCRNTKTITVNNLSNSPLIHTYNWQFVNSAGTVLSASTSPAATYTFPDTGVYRIKLAINQGEQCSDSTSSPVRVYPGFAPAFTYSGICFSRPTDFFDASTSVYGTVNSWSWDFGEPGITSDFSTSQNPIYTYPTMSNKIVVLTATDTKGCKDTVSQVVPIQDKPAISLAFRDTLICVSDAVQLQASGNGIFSWTPNINISNPGSATPIVSPVTTTTYIVSLDDQGCHNKDSVKVRVIDHVSLAAMNDTTICRGDTIRLHVVSDGLHYNWTPSNQFIDPSLANPLAVTFTTTTYHVTAVVGSCSATDNVMVKTIPYPYANAGNDVTICYNSSVQLHGTMDGIAASWSPSGSLNDPHILNPVASPPQTTSYVLSVTDVKGCPKPGRDTVIVTVLPKIIPFAGRDTAVVIGQPLQLNASGGFAYQWIPSDYLSSSVIANPVAQFDIPIDAIRYKVLVFDEANCVDSAFITVKVFKSMPTIFVPSAFTPNNDGLNDVLRPLAVGIQQIDYFRIYNRWGQLVFSTQTNGDGWDGKLNGELQGSGSYVWIVKATDYLGKAYFQRGTFTLVR